MKKHVLYSGLIIILFLSTRAEAQSRVARGHTNDSSSNNINNEKIFNEKYSTTLNSQVSNYIHIPAIENKKWKKITGFILKNISSSGDTDWVSGKTDFAEKDSSGYFVKVNVPLTVLNNSKEVWCTAFVQRETQNGIDTIPVQYGGVQFSKIKLYLKSTPQGAETFLIPNRIWMQRIENTNWEKDNSKIEDFRVNTSSTNTFAYVDETVFVVLYKKNNRFKKIIHYTKPMNVEQEQTAWVEF
jgi:hypothetical protein